MRKEFVECKDRRTAIRRCPWACVIIKVNGGFWAYECASEYQIWKAEHQMWKAYYQNLE